MANYNAKTGYYFLLGNPVAHSLSPLIHNAGFEALGINAVYLAAMIEPADLPSAIKGLKALSTRGFNVTSPFKETVIPFLDNLSAEAQIIGSVNTIVNRAGSLDGTSTDGEGFYRALLKAAPDFDLHCPALLIGAGGVARAVAYNLAQKGLKELFLANRSPGNAENLARLIKKQTPLKKCHTLPLTGAGLREALAYCRLIIYCLPLDAEEIKAAFKLKGTDFEGKFFFDLRYSPAESAVMKLAELAGAKTFNGLGLLFRQALLAFELFTGLAAPAEQMALALRRRLDEELRDDSF